MKQKKSIKANIIQEDSLNDKIIKIPDRQNIVKKNKDNNVVLDSFFLDTKFAVSKDVQERDDELLVLEPQFQVIDNQAEIKEVKRENIFDIKSKKNQSLQIKKISKSLGGRPILKNISLTLEPGKIVGLLGPNGSGKTTLFNLIIGKIFPDQGEIIFNDEVIHNLQIHTRSLKGLSLLEQHKGLFGNMTAEENLFAILELHIKDKEEINDQLHLEVMLDLREDIIKLLNMFLIRLKIILRNNFYVKSKDKLWYTVIDDSNINEDWINENLVDLKF